MKQHHSLTLLQDRAPSKAEPAKPSAELGNVMAERLQEEGTLIRRCLAGDEGAWDSLYHVYHGPLLEAIRYQLRCNPREWHLVEEIAARVWYALVHNKSRLLASFDASRQISLAKFLGGMARIEILRLFRAERRRHAYELSAAKQAGPGGDISDAQVGVMLNEFFDTLTPGEKAFLRENLLGEPADHQRPPPTAASVWQRRHRIREKLTDYFDG